MRGLDRDRRQTEIDIVARRTDGAMLTGAVKWSAKPVGISLQTYAYPIRLGTGRLTPGIGATWESGNLVDYYYGVTPAEALPTRPAYSPGSVVNPSARLDYTRPLSAKWTLGAGVAYTHFGAAIRHSPLVNESGSRSFTITLIRSFSFDGKEAAAPVPDLTKPLEH
jgi:outer membrane scaffolding protein for murein synthesis (MipA/OmpV family)